MAKRTPAPKLTPTPPVTALVPPAPSLATPAPVAPRSFAEWMMVPTYLMLAIAFVPVCWLTGSKKAK